MTVLAFWVPGEPVPKQSFRFGSGRGHSRISQRVADWQENISGTALAARQEAGGMDIFLPLMTRYATVTVHFYRSKVGRCDLDNLFKAVLDGLKKVVFEDDDQVKSLHGYMHSLQHMDGDPYADKDIKEAGCDIAIRYWETSPAKPRTNRGAALSPYSQQ